MGTGQLARFRHIAIEGPIGVGKSTLARRMSGELGAGLLLERAEENPFLERFYGDRAGYAFQTQVFFLFQRVRQMRELAQPGMFERAVVSDFMLAKDAIFARMNLSDEEYRLYSQMYQQMSAQVPQPDLIVWLQAPPALLTGRIQQRGIAMEQRIDEGYLQTLCKAYADFFVGFDAAPVMVVDCERANPALDDADFNALLVALDSLQAGRGVFEGTAR